MFERVIGYPVIAGWRSESQMARTNLPRQVVYWAFAVMRDREVYLRKMLDSHQAFPYKEVKSMLMVLSTLELAVVYLCELWLWDSNFNLVTELKQDHLVPIKLEASLDGPVLSSCCGFTRQETWKKAQKSCTLATTYRLRPATQLREAVSVYGRSLLTGKLRVI